MILSFETELPFRGLNIKPFGESVECIFGKQTLIFGRNGAGKTSLSELFRLGQQFDNAEKSKIISNVNIDGISKKMNMAELCSHFRIFVFNRFYVKDSLALFLDGAGTAPNILKLGSENVNSEVEIQTNNDYLSQLSRRRELANSLRRELLQSKESIESKTKSEIIASLSRADGANYNPTRFQVTHVRRLFENLQAKVLDEYQFSRELEIATSAEHQEIKLSSQIPSLTDYSIDQINSEILGKTIESVRLARLTGNSSLSEWVQQGLELNHEGQLCEFCQSGFVSGHVLDGYKNHFSSALISFRNFMIEKVEKLLSLRETLASWIETLPDQSRFQPDFRAEAIVQISNLQEQVRGLEILVDEAITSIRQRIEDPLNPLNSDSYLRGKVENLKISELVQIINQNNNALLSQNERIQSAKTAIETHFGSLSGDLYRNTVRRIELLDKYLNIINTREKFIIEKTSNLLAGQKDTDRMAISIDNDLHAHFGHSFLRVSASSDSKGYVVSRNGEVATFLSEGERNAIAFIYFLRTLEEEGVDPERSIVFIDDPVTSLDKEGLYISYSLAKTCTSDFSQVIHLTHDFEYFRLHLRDMKSRWDRYQKKQSSNNQPPPVSILEIRSITTNNGNNKSKTRSGTLRVCPEVILKHASEYHYLFLHVAEAVIDQNSEKQEYLPMLGNVGRRLLEGFLSFRAPNQTDFRHKIEAVANANQDVIDENLSHRVRVFLNSQSHREEPRPSETLDFPSIQRELQACLLFMFKADKSHFLDMCSATKFDPAQLIEQINIS